MRALGGVLIGSWEQLTIPDRAPVVEDEALPRIVSEVQLREALHQLARRNELISRSDGKDAEQRLRMQPWL